MSKEINLLRFIHAQERNYKQAITELRDGKKRTHWIWFIFPQVEGLGNSPANKMFAIKSIDEAIAYAQHPVLGERLVECFNAVLDYLDTEQGTILDLFANHVDVLKFKSCVTLFANIKHGNAELHASVLSIVYALGKELTPCIVTENFIGGNCPSEEEVK